MGRAGVEDAVCEETSERLGAVTRDRRRSLIIHYTGQVLVLYDDDDDDDQLRLIINGS